MRLRLQSAWRALRGLTPRIVLEVAFLKTVPAGITSPIDPFVSVDCDDFRAHEFFLAAGQEVQFHMPNGSNIEVSFRM